MCFGYIHLRQYWDAERFSVLPVKDRDFCINFKGLSMLTAHGAFNLRESSLGPLWKLEVRTGRNMPFTRDP